MPMSSDDIIHHMACDISQWICHIAPGWPYPDEPADAYTDAVCKIFGDEPTEATVMQTYRMGTPGKTLQDRLNTGLETDIITEDMANQLVRRMIVNNFGTDAVS